jgi:hypothetical protein
MAVIGNSYWNGTGNGNSRQVNQDGVNSSNGYSFDTSKGVGAQSSQGQTKATGAKQQPTGSQIGTSEKGGYPAKALTISPKNATPATTPHAVEGAQAGGSVQSKPYSPMPNNQLAQNPPLNRPPVITAQQHSSSLNNNMNHNSGNPAYVPDTGHYRQQTVAGDLFSIQGFTRGTGG